MRPIVFVFVCSFAAACALAPDQETAQNQQAVLDAYWIAHGMAESYRQSPDADPAVTAELDRLDRRASEARGEARNGGFVSDDTERAVAALSDYAASQTAMSR